MLAVEDECEPVGPTLMERKLTTSSNSLWVIDSTDDSVNGSDGIFDPYYANIGQPNVLAFQRVDDVRVIDL